VPTKQCGQVKRKKMKKIGLRKTGGRNNQGRITVRHIGGGYKRLLRPLDYQEINHRTRLGGKIISIDYDPNRTAYVATCDHQGKRYSQIAGGLTPPKIGAELKITTLGESPIGGSVYNVSMRIGGQGQISTARGTSCKIVKQESHTTVIRLPSSELKRLSKSNTCLEGSVYGRPKVKLGSAGANRRLGVRPKVRGVAMNPCDHPNGGKTHSSKIKNL
jgi:large subunit ribosomal protein L2